MSIGISVVLIMIISICHGSTVGFTLCEEDKDMGITSVKAVPWPPRTGLSSAYEFEMDITHESSQLYMNITYQMKMGFHTWKTIVEEKMNLCDGIIECPVVKGHQNIKFTYTLPSNTPVGNSWRGYVTITNEKGKNIGCIELDKFKVK